VTGAEPGVTRITVTAFARARAAIQRVQGRSGGSLTTIVNAALPLYAEVTEALDDGAELIVRSDGREQRVRFF